MEMKILWLRETFPWMGKHSGYDRVCDIISENYKIASENIYRTNSNIPGVLKKLLNPVVRRVRRSKTYNLNGFLAELNFLQTNVFRGPFAINHILYIERGFSLLSRLPKRMQMRIIGTAHQPSALWLNGRHDLKLIKSLDRLIVLSQREKEFFEKLIPNRVHFIRHGVDTRFFRPKSNSKADEKSNSTYFRCLYAGTWLRDTETLLRIVKNIISVDNSIRFDILVPKDKSGDSSLAELYKIKEICWHSDLSNTALRLLYQNANVLILPLLDCTANNAVLEAIACGLPVISTDVGGIRDYLEKSFADLFPIGAVDDYCEAILYLAKNESECHHRGKLARQYAEKHLSWEDAAEKTVQLYERISNEPLSSSHK